MDGNESATVYVIVLNYNGAEETLECLKSLKELNYLNYKVIVVDNCSTDDSLAKITEWLSDVGFDQRQPGTNEPSLKKFILIANSENRGYAAGNNVGIRYAMAQSDFKYVWILNHDTVIDKESLGALIERVEVDHKIGLCGSLILNYDKKDVAQLEAGGRFNPLLGTTKHIGENLRIDKLLNRETVENRINYISGASVLATKNFLNEIGLMDERYFLFYEEVDWALRLRGRFKLGYAPQSIVYHKGSVSYQSRETGELADYYMVRNRILITTKFFPYYLPSVYIGIMFVTLPKRLVSGRYKKFWRGFRLILTAGRSKYLA